MTGPLAGIRVLDLGTRIGAPFAATLLADLGGEVIKVELPGQGDFMRSIGPFVGDYSLFWAVEGRGKKSITCDLRRPAGQALLKRLAGGPAEIAGDRLLSPPLDRPEERVVAHEGPDRAHEIALPRQLDLDHLAAQVGE